MVYRITHRRRTFCVYEINGSRKKNLKAYKATLHCVQQQILLLYHQIPFNTNLK